MSNDSHNSRSDYSLRPIVFSVKEAHETKQVVYRENGDVVLRHPDLQKYLGKEEVILLPGQQYPLIFTSMSDLAKALSSLSNSPAIENGMSLRDTFDQEFERYRALLDKTLNEEQWEPDYGSYVFDHVNMQLFLIAPEMWHRIGLVTSTGTLVRDVNNTLSWREVRKKLENIKVGFVGASVGGNLIEGVARELRPKLAKVADPDWIELNNLNRLERGTIRFLSQSRAARSDLKNPYDVQRFNKAEMSAYQQQMVDPYSEWFVYPEGLSEENIEQFLLGDGKSEPKIDVMVEEADDFPLKIKIRELCRKHRIPVLMMTDFGHCVIVHFQDFEKNPEMPLGFGAEDDVLKKSLDKAMTSGNRDDIFGLVELLCGPDCIRDEFALWIKGEGEQPTSSLPQSGATALIAGGLGGKFLALHYLGHPHPARTIFDFAKQEITE